MQDASAAKPLPVLLASASVEKGASLAKACGACHNDVNFATGEKHAGGPQFDDKLCANCHIPQGEIEFDASIKGAHAVPDGTRAG